MSHLAASLHTRARSARGGGQLRGTEVVQKEVVVISPDRQNEKYQRSFQALKGLIRLICVVLLCVRFLRDKMGTAVLMRNSLKAV